MRKKLVTVGTAKMPENYREANNLCFFLHDVMVEALRSGEESRIFHSSVKFADEKDKEILNKSKNIFDWLGAIITNSSSNVTLKPVCRNPPCLT